MRHRIAAVWAVSSLALGACGGGASSEEARRIIVNSLINDAGLSPEVAACVADGALAEHEPEQLVNASGTTTDEVNESVQAITVGCLEQLTPTTTAAPTTTAPTTIATTEPTEPTEPVDLDAFCSASYDLVVALVAAQELDEPGPPVIQGWFGETTDRVELAVLTAPERSYQDRILELNDLLEEFERVVGDAGYDVRAVSETTEIEELIDDLDTAREGLRAVLDEECDREPLPADVQDLIDELLALDTPDTSVPDSTTPGASVPSPSTIDVDNAESGIRLTVPDTWAGEEGGVAATDFSPATRYLIRSPDVATFKDGGFNGEGVGIFAVDGTVDYDAFLTDSEPSQACALDAEEEYDDGVYVGLIQFFVECGGTTGEVVVVGAADEEAHVALYLELRVPAGDDPAIDTVLNSFYV